MDSIGVARADDASFESYYLPASLEEWYKYESDTYWRPWDYLRSFFFDCGYELYERKHRNEACLVPLGTVDVDDQQPNALGVYGTHSFVPYYISNYGPVWPARNRDGLDVMIKVISYKQEGASEVEILKYLSSEPVKSEADNPAVPLIDILCYDHWTFSVQPRWSNSVQPELADVSDGLNFCIQVTKGLAFLHRHLVAHLDVAEENILMNILGVEYYDRRHGTFLRLNFPIKYGIIDFGMSRRFEADKVPHLADIYTGRPTKAPEINQEIPYDPFAADVYQTGTMLLSLCWHLTLLTSDFAPIINSMMREDSTQRISMDEAHRRFAALNVPPEILHRPIDTRCLGLFRKAPELPEELETFRKHCARACSLFTV